MSFTYKTTTSWNISLEQQQQIQELMEERDDWLVNAVEAGKTDTVPGTPLSENPSSSERVWINLDAANEWKSFISNLAQKHEATVIVDVEAI